MRALITQAAALGDEELDVLLILARRVLAGQTQYGHLRITNDPRNFPTEALEEILDGMFYIGAALLQRAGSGRRLRSRRAGE